LKDAIVRFILGKISKHFTRFYWSSFIGRKWRKMRDKDLETVVIFCRQGK